MMDQDIVYFFDQYMDSLYGFQNQRAKTLHNYNNRLQLYSSNK